MRNDITGFLAVSIAHFNIESMKGLKTVRQDVKLSYQKKLEVRYDILVKYPTTVN